MCRKEKQSVRNSAIPVLVLLAVSGGNAQVSGYASATYGYHSNPLSNYLGASDQTLEGYCQLDYLGSSPSSDFKVGYVGGLMVFQDLAPRTYYEHRASIGFVRRYPYATEQAGEEEEEAPFRGNSFEFGGRLGARHDRVEYVQFDNWGADISGIYTWGAGTPSPVVLSNQTDLRRYANVPELDNLTTLFSLRLGLGGSATYSLLGGAGVKHYITSEVDTSVFQTVSSGSSNGAGKGRGKGIFAGTGNGKKDILVNASAVNTIQLNIGVAAAWQWEGGSLQSEALYRMDPGSSTRVLAQYANSTMLSEDLYNDFFSHAGPEIKLTFRQKLPPGWILSIDALAQRRKFLSPAFTIDGVQFASSRIDLHGGVELSLTRSVPLGESLSIDIGLTGGVLRNQSNDAYNDFSAYHYGVVAGMGF